MKEGELQKHIDSLRKAVEMLNVGAEDVPKEGLQHLGHAVDHVRKSVWGVLIAEHTGDYYDFLGKIRVRRATDTCGELVADLRKGTVTPDTPGFEVFHATIRELAKACRGVPHQAPPQDRP